MKKIVVVIPCYNEEESLPFTIKALIKVRNSIKSKYMLDILLVNDGSSDFTQKTIEKSARDHGFIYFRELSKNVGHQSALRAGIEAAINYDAVIMMDSDMQHPPEHIPSMIEKWEEGAYVVQMTREDTSEEVGLVRFWVGKLYYRLINALTDLNLDYGASDFRLVDRSVIKTVAASEEKQLFLRGYFSWIPVPRYTIPYKPNSRIAGSSKYTLRKLLDLAYKSVIQFSEKPLRIAGSIGLMLALASIIYGIVLIILYFTQAKTVDGWASLMVLMLFCFGINFILLGIIGNYLAHSINFQKKRPEYIVASEKLAE